MPGSIHLDSGDDITETELARYAFRTHTSDYVDVGLDFTVDHTANTLDIGSGYAVVAHETDNMAFPVSVDAVTDKALPVSSGVNQVWLVVDLNADDDTTTSDDPAVYYDITNSSTTPAAPSLGGLLKVGEVDTSADTSTLFNRGNTYQIEELSGGLTNDNVVNNLLGSNLSATNGNLNANIDGGDAQTLDGMDSTDFATQTDLNSVDAETLDGVDSSGFASSSSPVISGGMTVEDNANHIKVSDVDKSNHHWNIDHNDTLFRVFHRDEGTASFNNYLTIDWSVGQLEYTGTSFRIPGDEKRIEIGDAASAGPHKLLFGNLSGENRGGVFMRTATDSITIEEQTASGTNEIAKFPLDLSRDPTIHGNVIRTLNDGNSQPNITVGSTAPSNPDEDDVWIDTS